MKSCICLARREQPELVGSLDSLGTVSNGKSIAKITYRSFCFSYSDAQFYCDHFDSVVHGHMSKYLQIPL